MSIQDLRELPPDSELEADLCIVGAGPAGLTLALEFLNTGLQVCVLESGGLEREAATEDLNEIESVGLRRAAQHAIRCRGLGGTSALWTGRCGVFDAIDYQQRPWVPHSGWPISPADLEPYLDRAGELLGLGPAAYSDRVWDLLGRRDAHTVWDHERLLPVVWQYSQHGSVPEEPERAAARDAVAGAENIGVLQHAGAPPPVNFGSVYGSLLRAAKNVRVLLHSNATNVQTDETGTRVQHVDVSTLEGRRAKVRARNVVLACGGIDNARLLLCSRSVDPRGVGNAHDVVGRFLMDHPWFAIASYQGAGSDVLRRRLGHRWFDRHGERHMYHLGLRLSPEEQSRRGILNAAIHLAEVTDGRSPMKAAGRVLQSLKARKLSESVAADLMHVAGQPTVVLKGAYDRYFLRRPALLSTTRIDIGCVAEQVPDPESRVTLSEERDGIGMQRAKIDWRASDLELTTLRDMTSIVMEEIARLGYAPPEVSAWLEQDPASFRSRVHDMAHPMGSTRMSADPRHGVVDANGRVHGVNGLFIAGSSVFSTSGYMNPTLMIVSLSLRLAQHLKAELALPRVLASAPETHVPSTARRARVGIVGAGGRIRAMYLPILAALREEFEVVGFTTRSQERGQAFAQETGFALFKDAASLASATKPDFLMVAVSTDSVGQALDELTGLGIPLLFETPFSWSVPAGRRMLKRIRDRQLTVGVAEQTPFLPAEQFKRHLIDLGLIGRVVAAQNDFCTYDYHGIAQLRAYLGAARTPKSVSAVQTNFRPARERLNGARKRNGADEAWMLGSVHFDDGATLLHHYSSDYYDSNARGPRSIRVYGSSGSIIDDQILFGGAYSACPRATITRHTEANRLLSLSAQTPLGEVRWTNPFSDFAFDDEQIGVATLLRGMQNAVLFGGMPAYSAAEALSDIEILTAMRYSARLGGSPVPLPFRAAVERARVATAKAAAKALQVRRQRLGV